MDDSNNLDRGLGSFGLHCAKILNILSMWLMSPDEHCVFILASLFDSNGFCDY